MASGGSVVFTHGLSESRFTDNPKGAGFCAAFVQIVSGSCFFAKGVQGANIEEASGFFLLMACEYFCHPYEIKNCWSLKSKNN